MMRRLAALFAVALAIVIGSAGTLYAQTQPYSQPHQVTWTIPQHTTGNSGANFTKGYFDSLSFTLEGSGHLANAATVYDTSAVTDTLDVSPYFYNIAPHYYGTAVAADSAWYGRLTLTFTTPLAATDTVFCFTDVSTDNGNTWQSMLRTTANFAAGAYSGQVNVRQGALGWSTGGIRRNSANEVAFDMVSGITNITAGPPSSTSLRGGFLGVNAMRWRLALGTSSSPKTVDHVSWTYYSNGPELGR